jgi:hypothetical protein
MAMAAGESSTMEWAIGKLEGTRGMLVCFSGTDGFVAVKPKNLKTLFVDSTVAGVQASLSAAQDVLGLLDNLGVIDFDIGDAVESATGGGLLGMAAGAAASAVQDAAMKKAEEAIGNAVGGTLSTLLGSVSESEVMQTLQNGSPVLSVPRAKFKSVKGKQTGMISKSYELEVTERGWWIFSTTYKLKFGTRQIDRARQLHAALG